MYGKLVFLTTLSMTFKVINCSALLRTFVPIATAHRYCARKFTRHVMHRARALRNKLNNDREDGHCYSFAGI